MALGARGGADQGLRRTWSSWGQPRSSSPPLGSGFRPWDFQPSGSATLWKPWTPCPFKPLTPAGMFKNEYQGGAFVEIFSAQGKNPGARWKILGSPSVIWKEFDKEVKSFVFVLEGSSQTNKIQLPKENKQNLGLIQRFLVLQIYIPLGQDFSTELLTWIEQTAPIWDMLFMRQGQKTRFWAEPHNWI